MAKKKPAKKKAVKRSTKKATKKNVVPEHKLFEKHANHGNHLCELVAKRQMAKVARASKDAKYLCHICGRAANKKSALCEPVEI
jgi:hypothetical protein